MGVTTKHEALFKQPDAQQAAVRIESCTKNIKELESAARQLLKAKDLAQKEATDIENETDEPLKQERMRTAKKKVDEATSLLTTPRRSNSSTLRRTYP